ncbi:hypothetical protein [Paenibacillus antarcticus]|uniref:Spore coat protein D n=1 Tax=Paenibacillus antarcticus TaxID=253703 RepID=A0A168LB96_9BACL|nr:hypothetical protein [Paenibacillus antarcticus]OAB43134.1 hypothetical protein PBAT_19260 [Paenibacillus antarcticus]
MSHHCGFECPAVDPIVCDPIVVVRDHYFTQVVPVIHTIQVVNRHHCIPVEKHIYNCVTVEEGIEERGVERLGVSGKKENKRNATVSKVKTKTKAKAKIKSKK